MIGKTACAVITAQAVFVYHWSCVTDPKAALPASFFFRRETFFLPRTSKKQRTSRRLRRDTDTVSNRKGVIV